MLVAGVKKQPPGVSSEKMVTILASIQKISIGCTKDWVDDKLGPPFASSTIKETREGRVWPYTDEDNDSIVGELLECIYFFDSVSVQIYFDVPEHSCQAFFVSLLKSSAEIDIFMPDGYSYFVHNKPLGTFSFAAIDGEPEMVFGYVSNGVARAFYGEQYYYMGGGNYHNFCFAILDYGVITYDQFDSIIGEAQFDIGFGDYHSSDLLTQNRNKLCPNTYGISALNSRLTLELISDYSGFDSAQFREY